MITAAQLPREYEDLDPFVEEWGSLETQDERYLQRQSLPMERLDAYYKAVCPRLKAIFDHLDSFPYGPPLPPAEALLFRVVMGMSEVAHAVEMFGQSAVPFAPPNHSVQIAMKGFA